MVQVLKDNSPKVISANAGEATLGFDAVDTTLTLEDDAWFNN